MVFRECNMSRELGFRQIDNPVNIMNCLCLYKYKYKNNTIVVNSSLLFSHPPYIVFPLMISFGLSEFLDFSEVGLISEFKHMKQVSQIYIPLTLKL